MDLVYLGIPAIMIAANCIAPSLIFVVPFDPSKIIV